jgi:hypothetical protein
MLLQKKYKIYLDDTRTPEDKTWEVVKSYKQFILLVRRLGLNNITTITLDHDLDDSANQEYYKNTKDNYFINYDSILEKTGYDAAKWLVQESIEKNIPLPEVYTHSANPVGSANIMGYINNYLMKCNLPQTCVRKLYPFTVEKGQSIY